MPDPSGKKPDLSAGFVSAESLAAARRAEEHRRANVIYGQPEPRWWAIDFDALRARVSELESKLQEGIDGGHRAKAELDKSLEELYLTSGLHNVRLDELEDKAGSIGEWQEAVDTRLLRIGTALGNADVPAAVIVEKNAPTMLRFIASQSSSLSGGEKDWLRKAADLLEARDG